MKVPLPDLQHLAFVLQQAPGIGAASLRSVLERVRRECVDPSKFWNLDDADWQARFGIKPQAIEYLREPDVGTQDAWEQIERKEIAILVRGYSGYPKRLDRVLGNTAPAVLYALGNRDLFLAPGVGFCGSRKASVEGVQISRDCAGLLARQSVNVISGYAQGVDMAAHSGALEAGGTTTIVLVEGILHFRLKKDLRAISGDMSRILVVSEFPPGLPWKAHNAMTRNRTICGLADALVVVESGSEGGTFEAGKTALALKEPLFCVDHANSVPSATGNRYFLENGAVGLRRAQSGQPNLDRLLSIVEEQSKGSAQCEFVLHDEN